MPDVTTHPYWITALMPSIAATLCLLLLAGVLGALCRRILHTTHYEDSIRAKTADYTPPSLKRRAHRTVQAVRNWRLVRRFRREVEDILDGDLGQYVIGPNGGDRR
jgi:uncharacterized protein YjiS (DUF1127 family)